MLGAVRKGADAKTVSALQNAFIKMSATSKSKKVLSLVGADSLRLVADVDIHTARDLLKEYQALKLKRLQKTVSKVPATP